MQAMRRRKTKYGGPTLTLTIDSPGLDIDLDAKQITSDIVIELYDAHLAAIRSGERADTGQAQPALRGGRAEQAAKGQRPPFRGVTRSRDFVESIGTDKLSPKRVLGRSKRNYKGATKAKGSINVGSEFVSWLLNEKSRNIEYFYITGKMATLIEEELRKYLDQAIQWD